MTDLNGRGNVKVTVTVRQGRSPSDGVVKHKGRVRGAPLGLSYVEYEERGRPNINDGPTGMGGYSDASLLFDTLDWPKEARRRAMEEVYRRLCSRDE